MKYRGIITPMITPFDRKGRINGEYTVKLIQVLKKHSVNGLFPLGSTGLFPFLSVADRKQYLEMVSANSGNLTVMAGIGSTNTEESIELAQFSKDIGINAVVLMPTYYIKPGQNEIITHFSKVLGSTDMDLFIYNIPQLSGQRIEIDTMKFLKEEYSQIRGVKDSAGDMRFFQRIMELSDSNFSIFQGQDDLLYLSLLAGADGGICGTTNIMDETVRIYRNVENNLNAIALKQQFNIVNPLMDILNTPPFPSGYYYGFYHLNSLNGGYRTPMIRPESGYTRRFSSEIKKVFQDSKKYK